MFLLVRDGRLALRKRPAKGLLAGLWELPNVPGNLDEAGAAITLAQWGLTARTLTPVGAAKHIFSHVEWDMHGYLAAAEGENNEFLWADGAALQAAAIPRHSDTTSTRRSDGSPHNREEPIMAQLYFKYGAMGSSKTANALMARFNYEERGQQTLLVKPQLDTRDGDHMVHSRIGLEFPCVYFHEMREMSEDELKKNACIIVDEAQFLTREEVMYLVHLVDDCGIPVMCYGLRADFRGELFPGSYELLVMADKLEEVKTICWCGKKAAFNARFDANGKVLKEGEQVVLGANDQYIGLCRRHWMAGDLGPDFNGQGTGD